MEGERYRLHSSAVWMASILASGQMRRKSRMTEKLSQSLFFEIGLDVEFWDVLTVLLKGQSDKKDFDFVLVVFHRVIPLVLWKDRDIFSLVDDSVSIGVFAALGFDALIPEPFVSVIVRVSTALHLRQGSDQLLKLAGVLTL